MEQQTSDDFGLRCPFTRVALKSRMKREGTLVYYEHPIWGTMEVGLKYIISMRNLMEAGKEYDYELKLEGIGQMLSHMHAQGAVLPVVDSFNAEVLYAKSQSLHLYPD